MGGFMFENDREILSIQTKNIDEGISSCKSGTGKAQDSSNAAKQLNGDHLPQIESYTSRVFNLLSDFKCLSERACIAALRKAESADRLEESMVSAIITLRNQLDERDEDLQAKDEALKRLETRWRTKFEQLEVGTRKKAVQPPMGESAQEASTRPFNAELALQNTDFQQERLAEDLEAEIAALKLQLVSRTACLEEKELSLKRAEAELRASLQNYLIRVQETEAKLAAAETELEQKKILIETAALRESEICKLMDRLSSECEQLTEELHDKIALIARLEEKNHDHPAGDKAWKRVIGLEQPL
jgi:chromosome segregation ATPase